MNTCVFKSTAGSCRSSDSEFQTVVVLATEKHGFCLYLEVCNKLWGRLVGQQLWLVEISVLGAKPSMSLYHFPRPHLTPATHRLLQNTSVRKVPPINKNTTATEATFTLIRVQVWAVVYGLYSACIPIAAVHNNTGSVYEYELPWNMSSFYVQFLFFRHENEFQKVLPSIIMSLLWYT